MHISSASVLAAALFVAPAMGSAAPAPTHPPLGGTASNVQPVGWWEQEKRPNEARERYNHLPPNMRSYYDTLEYRIEVLDSWRGGDLRKRNPTEYRLMSDLIEQMRREQYAILQIRYHR
jgi:hypothetical protein